MNTKAIQQLADATLDKYRSSIPRKAYARHPESYPREGGPA